MMKATGVAKLFADLRTVSTLSWVLMAVVKVQSWQRSWLHLAAGRARPVEVTR